MDSNALFRDYIAVCNQIVAANKNRFPFSRIWSAAQAAMHTEPVAVRILTDQNQAENDVYIIQVKENAVTGGPHTVCPDCQCLGPWQVYQSYLQDVVRHTDHYIRHPALMDWDWVMMSIDGEGRV